MNPMDVVEMQWKGEEQFLLKAELGASFAGRMGGADQRSRIPLQHTTCSHWSEISCRSVKHKEMRSN